MPMLKAVMLMHMPTNLFVTPPLGEDANERQATNVTINFEMLSSIRPLNL